MKNKILLTLMLVGFTVSGQTIEEALELQRQAVARSIIALHGGDVGSSSLNKNKNKKVKQEVGGWTQGDKRKAFRALGKELESFGMGVSYRNVNFDYHLGELNLFMDNLYISGFAGGNSVETIIGADIGIGITRRFFIFGGAFANYEDNILVSEQAGENITDAIVERISSIGTEVGITGIFPIGKIHIQPKATYNFRQEIGVGFGIIF